MSEITNLLKRQRLNKVDLSEISNILMREKPYDIGNYLMSFPVNIPRILLENKFDEMSNEEFMIPFINGMIESEKFTHNSRNDAIGRAFPIVGYFLEQNMYPDYISRLFIESLVKVAEKTPISNTCDKIFVENLLLSTGYDFFNLNYEYKDDNERQGVFIVFTHLTRTSVIDSNVEIFQKWADANNFEMVYKLQVVSSASSDKNSKSLDDSKNLNEQGIIENDKNCYDELLTKITNVENMLIQNQNIESYNSSKNSELDIIELTYKVTELEKLLELEKNKSDDLTNRLKQNINSSSNLESLQLKKEISNKMKMEYEQFQQNINLVNSDEVFDAQQNILIRIFRALKQLGIDF